MRRGARAECFGQRRLCHRRSSQSGRKPGAGCAAGCAAGAGLPPLRGGSRRGERRARPREGMREEDIMSQRAIDAPGERVTASADVVDERSLLRAVEEYLLPEDVAHVRRVLAYARELGGALRAGGVDRAPATGAWDIAYVVAVAQTLAEAIHIDAISLGAVLLYQTVEGGLVTLDEVRARLGEAFGEAVTQTIANI